MGRKVELVPHNPRWGQQYEHEAAQITAVFQPILLSIHHIGSTAIPGIKAKPILDVLLVVSSIMAVAPLIQPMAALGYLSKGENGIVGRHYFRKGSDEQHSVHLHTYAQNHPEIARHLNFRDYLRQHPADALAYSQLKEQLAQQYKANPAQYSSGKTTFIEEIDSKARLWRSPQVAP